MPSIEESLRFENYLLNAVADSDEKLNSNKMTAFYQDIILREMILEL
jgi:hypothetical protein